MSPGSVHPWFVGNKHVKNTKDVGKVYVKQLESEGCEVFQVAKEMCTFHNILIWVDYIQYQLLRFLKSFGVRSC